MSLLGGLPTRLERSTILTYFPDQYDNLRLKGEFKFLTDSDRTNTSQSEKFKSFMGTIDFNRLLFLRKYTVNLHLEDCCFLDQSNGKF